MAARPSNPFDLAARRRGGGASGGGGRGDAPDRYVPSTVRTQEEIDALLVGYYEIAAEHWVLIPAGAHIRYNDREKGFRAGGFVRTNPAAQSADAGSRQRQTFHLQNARWLPAARLTAGGNLAWHAAYEDIDHVWMRADAATATILDMVASLATQFNKKLDAISQRLDELERRSSRR